jgi:hypothetical protein
VRRAAAVRRAEYVPLSVLVPGWFSNHCSCVGVAVPFCDLPAMLRNNYLPKCRKGIEYYSADLLNEFMLEDNDFSREDLVSRLLADPNADGIRIMALTIANLVYTNNASQLLDGSSASIPEQEGKTAAGFEAARDLSELEYLLHMFKSKVEKYLEIPVDIACDKLYSEVIQPLLNRQIRRGI